MQFQVPQFIETEDHILGPFTLKQFIYVCAAGGAAALLYFVLNTLVWILVAAPIIALSLAVAFIKINGRPFIDILFAAFRFYWEPQKYVWQPERPNLPKNEATVAAVGAGPGISLERLVSGLALKSAWEKVQTASRPGSPAEAARRSLTGSSEKFEIVQRLTGERKAARRIDYR